jgi:hypothetical protein
MCWAESGCEPNGLCRFRVKNARGLYFSGQKKGEGIPRGCENKGVVKKKAKKWREM